MIYPLCDLMNLLWLGKLFMTLTVTFLHAALPFLASDPKSNSAVGYTHTHTHKHNHADANTHSHTHADALHTLILKHTHIVIIICAGLYTRPYFL